MTPIYARIGKRLGAWLLISLGLHAALLAETWTIDVVEFSVSVEPQLSVHLAETQQPLSRKLRTPGTAQLITKADIPVQAVEPRSSETESTATTTDWENGQDRATEARVRSKLQAELQRYFQYPYLARLRGWQGRVVISLRITSDGRLSETSVTETSGYAILDTAALQAVNKVGRLPELADWLKGGQMRVDLPVVYQLVKY